MHRNLRSTRRTSFLIMFSSSPINSSSRIFLDIFFCFFGSMTDAAVTLMVVVESREVRRKCLYALIT